MRSSTVFLATGFLSCIGFFPSAALASGTLDAIRQTQTIIIAHRESSLPFSYLGANGQAIGFAVELCERIADAVRRELKLARLNIRYLPVTPADRIEAIMQGKADLECGSTTNNAARRKQVAFTIPHFVTATRMAVRKQSGIRNWADLRDKNVVTTEGTTTVRLLNERDKVRSLGLKLTEGRDHAESFSRVARGEADAFPMDDVLLYGLRAATDNADDFIIVGDALSTEPYAIMMRKGDAEFKAIVDKEMSRIINEGDIYKLYDKWFQSKIPPLGINMKMPLGAMLRDIWRYPSDQVP